MNNSSRLAAASAIGRSGAVFESTTPVLRDDAFATTTAFVGVCVLASVAPIERLEPLVRLPWQSISNVEAVAAAVFAAWALSLLWWRSWPRWRTPLTVPWLVLLSVMAVSSVSAPAYRANALHMTGRLAFGFAVFLLTVNGVRTPAQLRRATAILVAAGALAGALAILEYLRVPAVLEWLRAFRPSVTVVGAEVRATGPLQYPTIASMYLEIVLAIGLGLLLVFVDRGQRFAAALLFPGLVVVGEAIALTYARAGLLVMAISLAIVGVARFFQRGVDGGVKAVAALSAAIVLLFAASRSMESVWLRFTSEGQESWYVAEIEAPRELTLPAGLLRRVPLHITNIGRLAWSSDGDPPFYLSYHWLRPDKQRVVIFNGARTRFPSPVAPGASVDIDADIWAPGEPGRYVLAWDVVQEGQLWFSTEPGSTTTLSTATVSGSPGSGSESEVGPAPRVIPPTVVRPGRLTLWLAAARMIAVHPVLGVGPDNFRLQYGPYARLARADADPRTHSNNMYVEMMAGSGIAGGLAFLWLVWRAAATFAAPLLKSAVARGAPDSYVTGALGIGAAGLAVLLHGTVDSFLGFTPTCILIALTFGLAIACADGGELA